jgi:virginiamycin A acetyltransferase
VLGNTVLEGGNVIRDDVQFYGTVKVGRYTVFNGPCLVHGGEITIGRYSQLGRYMALYAKNHALETITTYNHPTLFEGRLKTIDLPAPIVIGNDAYIGHGALVLPGVTIGHGVIVGAGAVVTKNVDDYSIAVGNPARVIKKRFDDEVISLLLQWQWWNLHPEELLKYEPAFFINANSNRDEVVAHLRSIVDRSAAGTSEA